MAAAATLLHAINKAGSLHIHSDGPAPGLSTGDNLERHQERQGRAQGNYYGLKLRRINEPFVVEKPIGLDCFGTEGLQR